MPHVTPLRPDEPRRVGRYRLTGRIDDHGAAQDDFGSTYLARRSDGEAVTVTLLREDRAADAAARDRFMAEARVARQVPPFCAARILDAGFEGAISYLVAEFVPGPTLAEATGAEGPLPAETVRGVAAGAATGLAAIHQAGLVHGNLGPETLVLSPAGPRLVHFSITPPYHYATPAADMRAWAQTVLFAAVGPQPAARAPAAPRPGSENARPRGTRAPAQQPYYSQREFAALPADLQAAVINCLSPDPAARPTAREVLTELLRGRDVSAGLLAEGSRLAQPAARASTVAAPPAAARPAPRRRSSSALVLWLAACAACVLAIVAAVAYITHQHAPGGASGPATPGASRTGPPPQVPRALTGTWAGMIRQTHPVLSVMVRLALGPASGTIAYPALNCSGSLSLVSAAPGKLVVRQAIAIGGNTCENGVITLRPHGGKLRFTFARPGDTSPTGTLTRQR
jgi:eukaryotic-like serine/threonine-protein kinase